MPFRPLLLTKLMNNEIIKENIGAVVLMEKGDALTRWMMAGPAIISEFELNLNECLSKNSNKKRHEQYPALQ